EAARTLREPLVTGLARLDRLGDDSIRDLHEKEDRYASIVGSAEAGRAKLAADTWCAAFVAPKRSDEPAITEDVLQQMATDPARAPAAVRHRLEAVANEYQFCLVDLDFV